MVQHININDFLPAEDQIIYIYSDRYHRRHFTDFSTNGEVSVLEYAAYLLHS
jgi:hypothetical protein